jgi:hypothetical protein
MTTDQRLQRLETQNGRLRTGLLLLTTIILSVLVMAQGRPKRQTLTAYDEDGRPRIVLDASDSRPEIRFLDEDGDRIIEIQSWPGPSITVGGSPKSRVYIVGEGMAGPRVEIHENSRLTGSVP